jgi:hypothetical protein
MDETQWSHNGFPMDDDALIGVVGTHHLKEGKGVGTQGDDGRCM